MNNRTPIVAGIVLAVSLALSCEKSSDTGDTAAQTATTSQTDGQSNSAGDSPVADATPAPKQVDPEMYMMFVDRGLMKLQRNITICTLPWKQEFPERELMVELVFTLAPSGKVTGAKAEVPSEATRIGECIEQVVFRGQFSPGAPPKPFKKTMIFNPQDEETKKLRMKELPDKE